MLKEFKEFALKGNMIDMAVGIIIGGAFSTLVGSVVSDLFMPIISIFTGNLDFKQLFVTFDGVKYESLEAAQEAGASVFAYGNFITSVINFILLAIVVFLFVKAVNKMRKPAEEPEPTTGACPFCQSEVSRKAVKCPFCQSELAVGFWETEE